MIRLVSELTNKELLARIHNLEQYQIKVVEQLSKPRSMYEKSLIYKRRDISYVYYEDAILEAAYRKLITIH